MRAKGRSLKEYGILIPSAPNKVDRILENLRSRSCFRDRLNSGSRGTPHKETEDRSHGDIPDAAEGSETPWLFEWDGVAITEEDLRRVHSEQYVDKLFSAGLEEVLIDAFELRAPDGSYNRYDPARAKRPLSEILNRTLINTAGTYQCCRLSLKDGFCFFLGGGAHHGHYDFGHGFCPINDAVIAVRRLQAEEKVKTVWIIDVDVHKGDGTAALTQGDDSVITVSVHMAHGWPLDQSQYDADGNLHPSYIPSDFDIPIDSGEEHLYVPRLRDVLDSLAQLPKPDLAVVLCGADPYEYDELPSTRLLNLTLEQLYERDTAIFDFLTDLNISRAYLMAGGYGERAWEPYPPFLEYVCKKLYGTTT